MLKKIILFTFFLFFHSAIFAEGFSPETRIYTNYGPLEMQELQVGIKAFCMTAKGEITASPIIAIKKVEVVALYSFYVNGKKYSSTGSQLFYCINREKWVKLCELDIENDYIVINYCEAGKIDKLEEDLQPGCVYDKGATSFEEYLEATPLLPELCEKRFVYIISLKEHHAFFIEGGILCHNLIYAAAPFYLVYGAAFGSIVLNATLGTLTSYAVGCLAQTIITKLNEPTLKPSDQASPCQTLNQPQEKIVGCGTPPSELIDTSKPTCGTSPVELTDNKNPGCGKPDADLNKPLILSQPIPEQTDPIICALPGGQSEATQPLSCDNHGGRKIGDTIPADAPPVTIGDITGEATPEKKTGGPSTIFGKPDCDQGGLELDFARLKPTNIRTTINGEGEAITIGTLSDGRTIILRACSEDGRPTLELQIGKLRTKVRYGPITNG